MSKKIDLTLKSIMKDFAVLCIIFGILTVIFFTCNCGSPQLIPEPPTASVLTDSKEFVKTYKKEHKEIMPDVGKLLDEILLLQKALSDQKQYSDSLKESNIYWQKEAEDLRPDANTWRGFKWAGYIIAILLVLATVFAVFVKFSGMNPVSIVTDRFK